ncbi:hypothetical protein ACERIT_00910 [Halopenitus sp. H-Gu1]|uniref:hypothetical protein n=1 Tax=Halopenitus sp. H-Gu1 TaxID=3242697 RepID=UPI00359CEFA2
MSELTATTELGGLPTFLALDTVSVLDGTRRGASVQIDETYLDGQRTAIETIDAESRFERRLRSVDRTREIYDEVDIDIASFTEENLWDASRRYRELLQRLPETQYLKRAFPETCFVVPEWIRSPSEVTYGPRVYFFREDDAPDPESIIEANIEAVLEDTREAFDRYRGRLHGYPDCCLERFSSADRESDLGPEEASVEPIADYIDDDRLAAGPDPTVSITEIVSGLFETPDAYAFFVREFFPEPGCETARRRGIEVYETLSEVVSETLVQDHFRMNAGWNYVLARSLREVDPGRPAPGLLGREHLFSYLPLSVTSSLPRYREE